MNFGLIVQKVKNGEAALSQHIDGMIAFVGQQDSAAILKECQSQADAIAAYLAQQEDVADYNAAALICARVRHRLGEVLKATVKRGGDRKSNGQPDRLIPDDLGDTQAKRQNASKRTQQLAAIPWEDIEAAIKAKTEEGEKAKLGRIVKDLRQECQRKENKELVKKTTPLSIDSGPFATIAIDPPWDWGDEGDVSQFGRGRHEYAAASIGELLSDEWWSKQIGRPFGDLAKKDAHIYLWITNRSLPKGFQLLERWGFRYVTMLTWCKPSIGMGNYFRGSTEQILFGVRGSLPLLRADAGTWFAADRQGRHSTKPDEFYQLVETCSPGPWLEIFSRRQRPGWACWGAEA